LVNLKTKSAGDGYPKKAIEKTVLRFLGSRTFSHGLDPKPTWPSRDSITSPVRASRDSGTVRPSAFAS
jgi:hypothetical protein